KKKKDGGLYFMLNSEEITAEYRIYPIKEKKEWLLERVTSPQHPWPNKPPKPMLADSMSKVPLGDWVYEVKWDGIRALILLDEGEIKIFSRNHQDLSKQFPELMTSENAFKATSAVFDAEIVCLDAAGRPNFRNVIHRMQQSHEGSINRAMKKYPAFAYVFDCIYLDGRSLVNESFLRRREWMVDAIKKGGAYRVSQIVEEGEELFNAAKKMDLEGIMAKDIYAKYYPAKRTNAWVKVKVKKTKDLWIIGYTKGKGDREKQFGGLHLAEKNEKGGWVYRGKVGTGLTDQKMTELTQLLEKQPKSDKLVSGKVMDENNTRWIAPQLQAEVQFSMITNNGTLRDPVILRLKDEE
ncbi:MAG: non-homologous end-joining DNA ligase, partial [Fulvivirga sp.]|nr:non-homologous end-joining DNA ligase [Fulvivirga sp.]